MFLPFALSIILRGPVGAAPLAVGSVPAAVWPAPRSVHCSGGARGGTISTKLAINLKGKGASSTVATSAVQRYTPIVTENAVADGSIGAVTVTVATASEELGQGTDYSYTITYNYNSENATAVASGGINVGAASPFGVGYALETLSQFVGADGALACGGIAVDDAPAFVHRGIMIDTGRRFYPVTLVKQTIDGMAMTKQNVLHFHLSEECFRVQSTTYPQLTQRCVDSAGNNTAFYTHDDIQDIVNYAKMRTCKYDDDEYCFEIRAH